MSDREGNDLRHGDIREVWVPQPIGPEHDHRPHRTPVRPPPEPTHPGVGSRLPDDVGDLLGVLPIPTNDIAGSDPELRENERIIEVAEDLTIRQLVANEASRPPAQLSLDLG
jgi:hypothetical protein